MTVETLMNRQKNSFIILIFLLFLTFIPKSQAFAARPLVTEDAPTEGKGAMQLELGLDWIKIDSRNKTLSQSVTFTYGITNNLDFEIDKNYYKEIPFSGKSYNAVGDTSFSLKYRFLEETKTNPAMGIKLYTFNCDGDDKVSSGCADSQLLFFATKNTGFAVIHANLGATLIRPTNNNNRYLLYNCNLAFEKPLNKKLSVVGEIIATSSSYSAGPVTAQFGFTYQLSPDVTLDAGYTKGLNSQAPRGDFTTGVTIQF